jgi:hypothetical protein
MRKDKIHMKESPLAARELKKTWWHIWDKGQRNKLDVWENEEDREETMGIVKG